MKYVTVFTPTFNRASYLTTLYKSLLKQTNKNFEWYIVDGDSDDNTEELVREFIAENKIQIKFEINYRRSKYTSLINFAFKNSDSKLLFIVDSDDTITQDAVDIIIKNDKKYDSPDLAGYYFLCEYPESRYQIKPLENGEAIHVIELESQRKDKIDTCCQVYKMSVLKEYEFPDYNECFTPESVIWNRIDQDYKITGINRVIYKREYLIDGYTKSGREKNVKSPLGSMESNRYLLNANIPIDRKIKANLLFSCYGRIAKKRVREIVNVSTNKILTILVKPMAIVMASLWRKKLN